MIMTIKHNCRNLAAGFTENDYRGFAIPLEAPDDVIMLHELILSDIAGYFSEALNLGLLTRI